MTKRTVILLLISFTLIIVASGCKPACTPAEYEGYKVWPSSPMDGTIVSSSTPIFEWHSNEDCQPGQINLEITKNMPGPGTVYSTGGSETSYSLTTPLDPASKYTWKTYASSNGDIGKISHYWTFFTGPICSSGSLVQPILDVPANNGYAEPISKYSGFDFHWHYPGDCLPTTYLYEFASDPNFQDIVLSGETADYKSNLKWQLFPDCSTLYWRVAAKIGSQVGPWSEPAIFFYVYDHKCWQNHYLSDEVALIRGWVYEDQCSQTFQILPNGASAYSCIDDPWGIIGDGTMDYNEYNDTSPEPGLANVVVDLGAGPCPSTGLDQTTTGAKGKYSFTVLTPGEYCVSVSKNQTGYQAGGTAFNMMNGLWTEPLTKAIRVGWPLYLSPGWYDLKLNFGWDKYDAFLKPFHKEKLWCRWRPYPDCDPLHLIEEFDMVPMLARNKEGTWIMTSIQGETCYFYNRYTKEAEITEADVGMPVSEYLKNLDGLKVFSDPDPCPTPIPTPRPKPNRDTPADSPVDCSKITSQRSCIAAGCKWSFATAGGCYK